MGSFKSKINTYRMVVMATRRDSKVYNTLETETCPPQEAICRRGIPWFENSAPPTDPWFWREARMINSWTVKTYSN
jgi:hypothetical protein